MWSCGGLHDIQFEAAAVSQQLAMAGWEWGTDAFPKQHFHIELITSSDGLLH